MQCLIQDLLQQFEQEIQSQFPIRCLKGTIHCANCFSSVCVLFVDTADRTVAVCILSRCEMELLQWPTFFVASSCPISKQKLDSFFIGNSEFGLSLALLPWASLPYCALQLTPKIQAAFGSRFLFVSQAFHTLVAYAYRVNWKKKQEFLKGR